MVLPDERFSPVQTETEPPLRRGRGELSPSITAKNFSGFVKKHPSSPHTKIYIESYLEYRYMVVRNISNKLFWLGVISSVCATILSGFGVVLVLFGEHGESTISLFGQEIKTASVGVACIFIGAVPLVLLIRRIIKALEQFSKTE